MRAFVYEILSLRIAISKNTVDSKLADLTSRLD